MDDVDAAEKLAAHQGRKSVGGIALRAVSTQVAEGPGNPCGTIHTAFQSGYAHARALLYVVPRLSAAACLPPLCHMILPKLRQIKQLRRNNCMN